MPKDNSPLTTEAAAVAEQIARLYRDVIAVRNRCEKITAAAPGVFDDLFREDDDPELGAFMRDAVTAVKASARNLTCCLNGYWPRSTPRSV